MERMVHCRLYNLTESRRLLWSEQTGFCRLRSCEDQIPRITFSQSCPMAVLDPSIGFRMKCPCVPHHLRAFWSPLATGCATFYHTGRSGSSKTVKGYYYSVLLRQGLPQGAFPSLLLYFLCIDDLRSVKEDILKTNRSTSHAMDLVFTAQCWVLPMRC